MAHTVILAATKCVLNRLFYLFCFFKFRIFAPKAKVRVVTHLEVLPYI